jgi:hypothetical protein
LTGFPQSQLRIEQLMNEIAGDKAYIVVVRNGKQEKIEIEKEK